MSKLRDKLERLDGHIKKDWQKLDRHDNLSIREKLEKLVQTNLKTDTPGRRSDPVLEHEIPSSPVMIKDFCYPLDSPFGPFPLREWRAVQAADLALISGDAVFEDVDPLKMVFFDTETTGLSGGTGTLPFMLGFGFFIADNFLVRIFILNEISAEAEFLNEVDTFLKQNDFSAVVSYNGKSFDFPIMETRYILQRRRFPLAGKPHLDFLFPARTLWKNTYETRKLGYLGDILLNISREDDIDGSLIPDLYFSYLRSRSFSLIEKVIEHNALDVVGLAALVLLGTKYVQDLSHTRDDGEVLGVGMVFEKAGRFDEAVRCYHALKDGGEREDIVAKAVKKLSLMKKREKLFHEAADLWKYLSRYDDHLALRELSVHYEHRERDYVKALSYVEQALENLTLSESQKQDLQKRLLRLKRKLAALDNENTDT